MSPMTIFEVIQDLMHSKLIQGLFYAGVTALVLSIAQKTFSNVKKRKNNVHIGFIQGIVEAVIVVVGLLQIISLSAEAEKFYNTIVLSSSVIVVVMGFIFQEGMKNIVHGFFISLYRPFDVGDWIEATVDGRQITGYVESMTLRHTVVRNFYNGSLDIIPNSVLDTTLIENANSGKEKVNSKLIEVEITYESDLEKAKKILSDIVLSHPNYLDVRPEGEKGKQLSVFIGSLASNGVLLQIRFCAATIEECNNACSDVREQICIRFPKEGVEIAYPHVELLGNITVQGKQR